MTRPGDLKRLSPAAIPAALAKAERYRLLNDPEQAESIYLDVLAADPDHQGALAGLVLALSDHFERPDSGVKAQEARACLARLTDPYQRTYHEALVLEREARALVTRPVSRGAAYEGLRLAMEAYERAESLRPSGNDDAILRWNSCRRTLDAERLTPAAPEPELPLE